MHAFIAWSKETYRPPPTFPHYPSKNNAAPAARSHGVTSGSAVSSKNGGYVARRRIDPPEPDPPTL